MTKAANLRAKTEDQLGEELGNLKREAFNLRFQAATSQLEKPSRVKEVRKDIARIKTLQNERAGEAARGQTERSRSAAK
jgi:large subunit ribosomal protein L29